MTRTTPPRPADVAAAFPQLAPLARTATRLHPRPGPVTPNDSSIGGPLLWPASEPWPHCDGEHEPGWQPPMSVADARLLHRIDADSYGRTRTADEAQTVARLLGERLPLDRAAQAAMWDIPEEPLAMLPIAQLYARDVPSLRPPEGKDLLQVLWCPFGHDSELVLRTRLFWRASREVTDILVEQPEPAVVEYEGFVPNICRLHPETVTEYPKEGIDSTLVWALEDWGTAQDYEDTRESFYSSQLSTAPGCKVGGWTGWSRTDPSPMFCVECGARMDPLLTIASWEWGGTDYSWIPFEDREERGGHRYAHWATGLQLGDVNDLQLVVCSVDPTHPHASHIP